MTASDGNDAPATQQPRPAEEATGPPELIIALSNAGCSVRFYRTPVAGGFVFRSEVAMARVVSEDFDIEWENVGGDTVGSFADLAPDIAGWLILSPVHVHPDYRAAAWRVVQEAVERLPADRRERLASRLALWRRACHSHADEYTPEEIA
jgi:hypothetical protein